MSDLWIDGACSGNPGPGGWAACFSNHETWAAEVLSGSEAVTTNNRMELQAAISGLQKFGPTGKLIIHTDSEYVRKGITEWVDKWVANGWRSGKKPVKNQDLWVKLVSLNDTYKPKWEQIPSWANTKADALARLEAQNTKKELEKNPAD